MANTREKQIQRLNELGEEWYAIDAKKSPAEKKKKFWEIYEIVFKIFTLDYFTRTDENGNVSETDGDDKKKNILFHLLIEKGLDGFEPSVSTLYGYISFCFFKRYKKHSPAWEFSHVRAGSKLDWNTVDISNFKYTDDKGNELDWESFLAMIDKGSDVFQPIVPQREMESVVKLQFVLESLMVKESTKLSARKKHIFRLIYSAQLINIAKDTAISRKGLQREREFMDYANQNFFVFCYDSDRQIYVSLNELEQTPLKTNRTVYQLAESCGKHYTLKDNLADKPIRLPIQKNIFVMYLACVEGKNITDSAFSQDLKKYKKHFDELLQSLRRS